MLRATECRQTPEDVQDVLHCLRLQPALGQRVVSEFPLEVKDVQGSWG